VKIVTEPDGNAYGFCKNGAIWQYNGDYWSVLLAGGGNQFYRNYGIGGDFIDINNGRIIGYAGEEATGTNLKLENGNWSYEPSINKDESFCSIDLIDLNNGWLGKRAGGPNMFANLNDGSWVLNEFATGGWSDSARAIALMDINNGWAGGSVFIGNDENGSPIYMDGQYQHQVIN